ncbi:MAG: hypothetical protein ACFFG0_09710 [Candidatus Thorarchaeota archaeon]
MLKKKTSAISFSNSKKKDWDYGTECRNCSRIMIEFCPECGYCKTYCCECH